MKKTILILCAFVAFVSCSKEVSPTQGFKFETSITPPSQTINPIVQNNSNQIVTSLDSLIIDTTQSQGSNLRSICKCQPEPPSNCTQDEKDCMKQWVGKWKFKSCQGSGVVEFCYSDECGVLCSDMFPPGESITQVNCNKDGHSSLTIVNIRDGITIEVHQDPKGSICWNEIDPNTSGVFRRCCDFTLER